MYRARLYRKGSYSGSVNISGWPIHNPYVSLYAGKRKNLPTSGAFSSTISEQVAISPSPSPSQSSLLSTYLSLSLSLSLFLSLFHSLHPQRPRFAGD
jgi:hypothetical protein